MVMVRLFLMLLIWVMPLFSLAGLQPVKRKTIQIPKELIGNFIKAPVPDDAILVYKNWFEIFEDTLTTGIKKYYIGRANTKIYLNFAKTADSLKELIRAIIEDNNCDYFR